MWDQRFGRKLLNIWFGVVEIFNYGKAATGLKCLVLLGKCASGSSLTRPPWTMRTNFSEAPIFVCWETTKSCLLACRHCRARAIRKPLPGELDHQQALNLIDELLEFDQPYPALLMTGGDPLMRADFFELIEYAKTRGLYVAVAASVTPLLNEDT
ncbi:MAG TPA: radical SAM protein, partial [Candidatus Acidoferrum sp.]|nr:radical SAM protein [Candidatus Acidoferrum sp.]